MDTTRPSSSSSSAAAAAAALSAVGIDEAAKHSASLESTAEAVMHAKTLLVDLDRRLNLTREGIRVLRSQQEAQHRAVREAEKARKDVFANEIMAKQQIAALVGVPGVSRIDDDYLSSLITSKNDSVQPSSSCSSSSPAASQVSTSTAAGAAKKVAEPPAPNTFVNPQPMWLLCSGGVFIQTNQAKAYDKLLKTSHETHQQIEETRHELKTLVAELAKLEGVDSALARANAGFELVAKKADPVGSR